MNLRLRISLQGYIKQKLEDGQQPFSLISTTSIHKCSIQQLPLNQVYFLIWVGSAADEFIMHQSHFILLVFM